MPMTLIFIAVLMGFFLGETEALLKRGGVFSLREVLKLKDTRSRWAYWALFITTGLLAGGEIWYVLTGRLKSQVPWTAYVPFAILIFSCAGLIALKHSKLVGELTAKKSKAFNLINALLILLFLYYVYK